MNFMNSIAELETLVDLSDYKDCEELIEREPDSRDRVQTIIEWANEFNAINENTLWGVELEYYEEIEKFAENKIKEL